MLLEVDSARTAGVTGIDKTTHRHFLAEFEFLYLRTHGFDGAHNFVARHQRVVAASPVVFGEMQIGMADTAKFDIDGYILRARGASLNVVCHQGLIG